MSPHLNPASQDVFTFEHPNRAHVIDNTRSVKLSFECTPPGGTGVRAVLPVLLPPPPAAAVEAAAASTIVAAATATGAQRPPRAPPPPPPPGAPVQCAMALLATSTPSCTTTSTCPSTRPPTRPTCFPGSPSTSRCAEPFYVPQGPWAFVGGPAHVHCSVYKCAQCALHPAPAHHRASHRLPAPFSCPHQARAWTWPCGAAPASTRCGTSGR